MCFNFKGGPIVVSGCLRVPLRFIRDAKEIIGKYIGLGSIEMPFSRLKQLSKAAVKRKSI